MESEMDGMQVFAKEEALLRLGNDQELYNDILLAFREELPGQLDLIKEHVTGKHSETLEHECHSLKGASANVGAEALAVLAGKMELSARNEHWNVLRTFLPRLETECKRVSEYLNRYFSNLYRKP